MGHIVHKTSFVWTEVLCTVPTFQFFLLYNYWSLFFRGNQSHLSTSYKIMVDVPDPPIDDETPSSPNSGKGYSSIFKKKCTLDFKIFSLGLPNLPKILISWAWRKVLEQDKQLIMFKHCFLDRIYTLAHYESFMLL